MTRPLLLIACSGRKLSGTHRAIDLYHGVMFQVLRKWMPREAAPDVYIISALRGVVHADTRIATYEQPMTEERQQLLLARGAELVLFRGKHFNEVFIAGGAMYRAVAEVIVRDLLAAGVILPGAPVRTTSGGIGEQRGQLGAYLREVEARAPLPHYKRGDVLVRRVPLRAPNGDSYTAPTDQLTLLEDTNPAEAARVRTPAEGTLLVRAEYVGERQKIDRRWRTPILSGQFDNVDLLRNYVLKGGQRSLI